MLMIDSIRSTTVDVASDCTSPLPGDYRHAAARFVRLPVLSVCCPRARSWTTPETYPPIRESALSLLLERDEPA